MDLLSNKSDSQNTEQEGVLVFPSHVNRSYRSNHASAFIVETILLLVFVTLSMTTLTSLFAKSHSIGSTANETTAAIILATTGASNGAEDFSADPTGEAQSLTYYEESGEHFIETTSYKSGDYTVRRDITEEARDGGTMYTANIEVSRYNKVVYKLTTKKYLSEGRG